MKEKLLKEIDIKIKEKKGNIFINETGGYGTPYKQQIIDKFDLDEKYSKKINSLSYGDVKKIMGNIS